MLDNRNLSRQTAENKTRSSPFNPEENLFFYGIERKIIRICTLQGSLVTRLIDITNTYKKTSLRHVSRPKDCS